MDSFIDDKPFFATSNQPLKSSSHYKAWHVQL